MRKHFNVTVDGQEVSLEDLNTISYNAAMSEDRALAELLRMMPPPTRRGVIPCGYRDANASFGGQKTRVLGPSLSTDARVFVYPFRAVVGSRIADTSTAEAREIGHRDIRSAMCIGPLDQGHTPVTLTATSGNNRCDLIYVRVDVAVPSTSVNRYVKDEDGVEGVQSLSANYETTCTIGVVVGTEGASPARPALPADTGTITGSFYIPLGYVYLQHPFTSGSSVGFLSIVEVAPILGIAPTAGGVDARPVTWASNPDSLEASSILTWEPSPARGVAKEFLPATMSGLVTRYLGLDFTGGHASLPLNATTALDTSIDWRKRLFRVHMQAVALSGTEALAWVGSSAPVPGAALANPGGFLSSSFAANSDIADGAVIVFATPSTMSAMGASSSIRIYVDLTNGYLKAKVAAANPAVLIFFWIDASGPYANATNGETPPAP